MADRGDEQTNIPDDIADLRRAITEEEGSELTDIYNAGGFTAIAERLKAKLSRWETIPVNIAVTGESGAGKSSFINAIRGLTADDDGAAAVGIKETTLIPRAYAHPQHPNLVLWDLPGIGTTTFPPDEYLTEMQFDKFDFFIIVSSERFTIHDMSLAKAIRQVRRKFYFLRAKIDMDLYGAQRSHPRTFDAERTIQVVRDDTRVSLESESLQDMPIFVVDNYDTQSYDFPAFTEHMAENLPDLKREAFVFSLDILSPNLLDEKEKMLRSRVWRLSTLSAACGVIPLPGAGLIADIGILMSEFAFYQKQFGLDDKSLRSLATIVDKEYHVLKSQIKSEVARNVTKETVLQILKGSVVGAVMLAEELLDFIPIVGMIAGGTMSFITTFGVLSTNLTKMRKEGDRVLAKAFEK